jgi:hypothetical protein
MKNSFFHNNPHKLTYNEQTNTVQFVPQTKEDKEENQKLIERLNNTLKDKTSESYLNAKSLSDNLKAEIEKRFRSKNC